MAKKLKLGNQVIEVSDELEQYNELRHAFSGYADQATARFEQLYKSENYSLHSLAQNCKAQTYEGLMSPVTECIRLMLPQGIYDVDTEIFINEYCQKYLSVLDVCDKYIGMYTAIEGEREAEKEYRRQRRANRPGLIAGGFGLAGMVQAMGISLLYDSASWLAHTAVNAIGNRITDLIANSEERSIINDPQTLPEFIHAMWSSSLNTHYAYLDLLESRTGKTIPKYSLDDRRSALAIHNNINLILPDRETEEKMAVAMLSLQPYEEEYYADLIRKYGDESGELQEIAEFFYIDIDQIKSSLLHEYAGSFDYDTMSSAEDMLKKLTEKAEYYGMTPKSKKQSILHEKVDFNNYQCICWIQLAKRQL